MQGQAIEFSESDLDASARAYDPELSEAPIVVGHPATDAPAYGWVQGLERIGDRLAAAPRQIDPAFAEMVNAGRFKKISAAFYLPSAPNNPVPGVYYLRHVGFLGAQPPAVKGLRDARFADTEGVVTIEFGEQSDYLVAQVFRSLREWLIEKYSPDDADRVVPNYVVDGLQAEANREASESASEPVDASVSPVGFSETHLSGDQSMADQSSTLAERERKLAEEQARLAVEKAAFAEQQAALKQAAEEQAAFAEKQRQMEAREAEFAERETKLRDAEETARKRELAEFSETLIRQGRLLPRDKDSVVAFMAGLDPAATVEFGEGDEKTSQTPLVWFQEFLKRMPVQVRFGEMSSPEAGSGAIQASDAQIAARARTYHAAAHARGENISFAEAVDAVRSNQDGGNDPHA